MEKVESSRNLIGIINCSLLVAGTCIGGGMLALPISTGYFGFFPTICVMLGCCAFMTITSFYYLEATLWMGDGAHINTLANKLLGKYSKLICVTTYIFICYTSLISYNSAGGKEILFALKNFFGLSLKNNSGILLFSIVSAFFIFYFKKNIEKINSALFGGLLISYLLLISQGLHKIDEGLLFRNNIGGNLIFIVPILFTTFSFPGIVPSITKILKNNKQSVVFSIFFGTLIACLFYIVWLMMIFGTISYDGECGLLYAFENDIPPTECLHKAFMNPIISTTAQIFSFFAIITSFIGIYISLIDFLRDTFTNIKGAQISFIVLAPTLLFTLTNDKIFISSLEISGGVGDSILSGIIPALMVWNGRKIFKKVSRFEVFGGRALLVIIFLISTLILMTEIYRRLFL